MAAVLWTIIENRRERRRQRRLAETRPPIDRAEFARRLQIAGTDERVANFVWDQLRPYYVRPLTPYPGDRPLGGMRIDPEDVSDIVMAFEKEFDRHWIGKWIGPEDPTLEEFAEVLWASTETP